MKYNKIEQKYLILDDELTELNKIMLDLQKQFQEQGKRKGGDWHDNFDFEDGEREQEKIGMRMSEINILIKESKVLLRESLLATELSEKVTIGKKITIVINGQRTSIVLGGHKATLSKIPGRVGYTSELGKNIFGKQRGERCEFIINGKKNIVLIEEIE